MPCRDEGDHMKIAVLSDIHANHLALEACLDRAKELGAQGYVFLGDHVTDFPYPKKTMELLYICNDSFPCWFIRGNREDYLLGHRYNADDGWSYCSQSGSLLYTFEELDGSDLRFFEDMPVGMEIKPDGLPPFSICHATMSDNRRLFYPNSEEIGDIIKEQATELMVCGHTHGYFVYDNGNKRIINAGAVTRNRASMLILTSDGGKWQAEHYIVDYDVEAAIQEFTESGLIEKANGWVRGIIATLRGMGDIDLEIVNLVGKLCEERHLPFNDESLWQEAAEKLGI